MDDEQARPTVILIAPNVSPHMGGEAMKALQIYQSLKGYGLEVHQVTHDRVRSDLDRLFPGMSVSYVKDGRIDGLLSRSRAFGMLINPYFMWRAAKIARELVRRHPGAVVHYTSPISPVVPLFPIEGARVVVGPINGNIHHPPGFRRRESLSDRLRRLLLVPSQAIHRAFFSGKQTADVILVAGGERTSHSLRIAGCRDEQFVESLDSGVPDALRDAPPIEHAGVNLRFVHHGRLVPYKGTDLAIRAVARARNPVELDVIGRGETRGPLERLAAELGVADRVRFLDWMRHDELIRLIRQYRGFVAPSLAEANGIVYQEAMMIGLPIICLDWGGPALLVTPETGFAIPAGDEDQVVDGLAGAMDRLSQDGELANRLAIAGRAAAIDRGFAWSDLIEKWVAVYRGLAPSAGRLRPAERP